MRERKTAILEILSAVPRVAIRDLAERFDVSEMTIRRDLDELAERGIVVRTRGGAVTAAGLRSLATPTPEYAVSPRKAAIGRLAAGLIGPGETIMVDADTTTLEVARCIPRDLRIALGTTSLCVAQMLYESDADVVLFGGLLCKEFPSTYGPMTEAMLRTFHVDTLFIGCDGANSLDGFYTTESLISALKQTMIGIAERVVLVTESAKFVRRAFARYAVPSEINIVVTDSDLPELDRSNLENAGVTVMVAGERE